MSEKKGGSSIRDTVLKLNQKAREMPEEKEADELLPVPVQGKKKHKKIVYRYRVDRVRRVEKETVKRAEVQTLPMDGEDTETDFVTVDAGNGDTKEVTAAKKTAEFPAQNAKHGTAKGGEESGETRVAPAYIPSGAREKRYDTGEIAYVYSDEEPSEIPGEHLVPPSLDDTDYDTILSTFLTEESDENVEGTPVLSETPEDGTDSGTGTRPAQGGESPKESGPEVDFATLQDRKRALGRLRRADRGNCVRIALCALLLLLAFLYETLPLIVGTAAAVMDPKVYPVTYVMIDLQLLFFGAALILKNLARGAVDLMRLRPDPDSITVVMLAATVAYDVLMCLRPYGTEFRLYHFPMLLCILLSLLYEFFTRRRETYSVEIASSRRPKFTVGRLGSESASLEMEVFGDYLGSDPSIFKINKTQQVGDFYKRFGTDTGVRKLLLLLLPLSVVLGIAFSMVGIVRLENLFDGVSVGYTALMLALPAASLLTFSFPFYQISHRAFRLGSAIIGEGAIDEYADASSVSFNDREVFPGNSVRVRSIKVFGNNRVDTVIYNVASVFRLVGGPLRDVFDIATADLGQSRDVRILSVDPGGIEAAVSGTHLFIGKADYLRRCRYAPIVDDEDVQVGSASIMYVVMNDAVVAKMYIQYRIDKDFEQMLRQLYKYGVCVGIRTFDPNIDDEMLSHRIHIQKYPVRVLKCREVGDNVKVSKCVSSGIVSVTSAKNLLHTFTLCRKTKRMLHTGALLNFIALFATLPVMLLALLFGGAHEVPSFYVVLYQLFWSVAVMLTPYFAAK